MNFIRLESNQFTHPEITVRKSNDLVSPFTGIIKRLESISLQPDDPQFYHYYSEIGDISRFTQLKCFTEHGGAAIDENSAIAKAVGEGIERYCGAFYCPDDFIRSSYRNMKEEAINPASFNLFSEKQYNEFSFPYVPFQEDTLTNWVYGFSLLKPRKILVPANFVYIPFEYPTVEETIVNPISTGLSCANTPEEALLSSINEVVERDAFIITWLNRLPMPRVQFDPDEFPLVQQCIDNFEKFNIECIINDITLDIPINVFMVTLISKYSGDDVPALAVATKAGLDLEHTLLGCIEEAAHTRIWARMLMREYLTGVSEDRDDYNYTDITDNRGHVLFYCNPDSVKNLDFLIKNKHIKKLKKESTRNNMGPLDQLKQSLDILHDRGFEIIGVDVTTPDIAEIGLHVIRVIIPGLHPLHLGYKNRCLGGKRLYEIPGKLGFTRGPVKEEDINPYPHPFP